MPDVSLSELPEASALHQYVAKGDFLDCYTVASTLPPRQAAEIITDFPGWAMVLMKLRRLVTTPFGLHNDAPEGTVDAVGIFPVEAESDTEVIAGFDDRHLNFRVCVRQDEGRVSLATWVHPHNIFGRIYLATIMPFHILISRNALARVAEQG